MNDIERVKGSRPVRKAAKAAPVDRLTIGDLETLRLLADPLRMRVMNAFADAHGRALKVKELAAQLGVRPTRLYYHINLLEQRGLLRVVASRVVSGIVEKSYAAAAASITVDPELLRVSSAGRAATSATLTALLQATAGEIGSALELAAANPERDEVRQMLVTKSTANLSPAAHAEFLARLNELVAEFESRYGSSKSEPNRAMFVAYYPFAGGKSK
jgi:DNA-binding transcriptional ArsR family regulator